MTRWKKIKGIGLYLVEVFHVKILIEKVTVPPCNSLSIEPEAGEAVSSAVRGVGGLVPPAPSEMFVRYPRLHVFGSARSSRSHNLRMFVRSVQTFPELSIIIFWLRSL